VCKIWLLTVWEEHIKNKTENRVLGIFRHKREGVTAGCRKLHNEELRILHLSPYITRKMNSRMRWAYSTQEKHIKKN
jgi:hypothetical protein